MDYNSDIAMPNLDIHAAIITAFVLAVIGAFFSFIAGVNSIRSAARLQFFRKRRDRMVRGWRFILISVILALVAFVVTRFVEPVLYTVYPPTATITTTPTITETPTLTLTLTISVTPTITRTPSVTNTPSLPVSVLTGFQSTVIPAPEAILSQLQFAQKLDENNLPVDPATTFGIPVGHLYGTFSFDKMKNGAQFSALWYRNNELAYFESFPWNGGTGGYGYTDWNPKPEEWLPGNYEVQIFIGTDWVRTGRFTVSASGPTPSTSQTLAGTTARTPAVSPTSKVTRSPVLPTKTKAP
jgi:hypothetical protein